MKHEHKQNMYCTIVLYFWFRLSDFTPVICINLDDCEGKFPLKSTITPKKLDTIYSWWLQYLFMTPLSCLAAVILNTQFSCTRHLLKYKKFKKTSWRGENIHSALTINAETIFKFPFVRISCFQSIRRQFVSKME